jgi:SAM-dependent methyltransferase
MRYPEPGTVRWHVSEYVRSHADEAMGPYLEIGSRRKDQQWWRDLRSHLDVDPDLWTGLDIEDGPNVDVVWDITCGDVPADHWGMYGTVICAEVLEHVKHPRAALQALWHFLAPGGTLIITTPFAFPIHGFPNDYWRFAPDGLRHLLTKAHFTDIEVDTFNPTIFKLRDHDDVVTERYVPMHVGAVCRRPVGVL